MHCFLLGLSIYLPTSCLLFVIISKFYGVLGLRLFYCISFYKRGNFQFGIEDISIFCIYYLKSQLRPQLTLARNFFSSKEKLFAERGDFLRVNSYLLQGCGGNVED